MMTFKEIYEIAKETKLNNYLINSLASENKGIQELAMAKVKALNFKTADDVKLYVAMNI